MHAFEMTFNFCGTSFRGGAIDRTRVIDISWKIIIVSIEVLGENELLHFVRHLIGGFGVYTFLYISRRFAPLHIAHATRGLSLDFKVPRALGFRQSGAWAF